jgi:hypothetical protein
MPLDITRFLVNRAVIERQGVPEADVNRLALVPSVLGGPLGVSVATAAVIGQNNAAPPPAAGSEQPAPGGGTGGTPGTVKIPDMAGWRLQDATDELTKLKLDPRTGRDPRAEAERVVRTDPPAGSRVSEGTLVVVFAGTRDGGGAGEPGPVTLPPMEGWRVADALEEAKELGLVAKVGTDPRGEVDRVYRTDPGPGAVPAGADVFVFTGAAPPPKAAAKKKAPARKAPARRAAPAVPPPGGMATP